jgi:hypothetical protein
VRANKSRASSHQNAFAAGWREQPDWRKAGKSGVGDRLGVRVVDRLRLIGGVALDESGMVGLLSGVFVRDRLLARCYDIMRAEIECSQDIDGNFTVKTKSFEADRRDFVAVLV